MTNLVSNWRQAKNIHKQIGKVAKIVSWTKVYVAPSGFEADVPYYAGIVEFRNGQRTTVQFVDFEDEPAIGQNVVTVVRRIGRQRPQDVIQYGIKVKPY
ncbi:OB-fold domain-containing protein [Candidatus Shapirobacteria bacterium]|nr:OB-fold domain-containing protein [Candidatus Shapirobacteria bacterium]